MSQTKAPRGPQRHLRNLLGPDVELLGPDHGITISGLTSDSRDVKPGDLFAAMPGTQVDGARFIPDALAKGASAVLCHGTATAAIADCPVPVLRANDPRLALARISARFYGAQPETCVAVTGTSGKSSVAEFTRQIFAALGHRAASLGTIGVVKPDGETYGSLTTPDPIALHRTLADLAEDGVTHLAFEASSHGLDQRRLDGVAIRAAAFTNLGRDHLDYHATMEAYLAAKLRLFTELLPDDGVAVVNADGAWAKRAMAVARAASRRVLTVGAAGDDLKLLDVQREGFGQRLRLEADGHRITVKLPLVGTYQAENALTAAGLALAVDDQIGVGPVLAALQTLNGVCGRLEIIGEVNGGLVVVDYAHKPEALQAVLTSLRPFARGRLICVFGCGGDRDTGKRALMGEIASRLADVTIVTDDNPRSESPAAIRSQILAATSNAQDIGDRAEAIRHGIGLLGAGDVVVIAGKGHETGQIIGDHRHPFSDHTVAHAAIAKVGGCD